MLDILITVIKIIFLLGFLIFIHEGGHFLVARMCKVKVNEFAIGFGPTIWKKQKNDTKYAIRLIPLGGFVSMEGEVESSNKEGAFSNASIPKRLAIVVAGAVVNIVFGVLVYFFIITFSSTYFASVSTEVTLLDRIYFGLINTKEFIIAIWESLIMLFSGGFNIEQITGPVGISNIIASTTGVQEFLYIMAVISISLGVTNLLPIPALDGGKILLLIIEAIRKKPLKQETEINITLIGFTLLITLSVYVAYNDIIRIF